MANTNPPLGILTLAFDGSWDFSYRDESRKLLEGQTYRIYLDSSADAQGNSGGSVHKVDHQQKVTADIVLGGGSVIVRLVDFESDAGGKSLEPDQEQVDSRLARMFGIDYYRQKAMSCSSFAIAAPEAMD